MPLLGMLRCQWSVSRASTKTFATVIHSIGGSDAPVYASQELINGAYIRHLKVFWTNNPLPVPCLGETCECVFEATVSVWLHHTLEMREGSVAVHGSLRFQDPWNRKECIMLNEVQKSMPPSSEVLTRPCPNVRVFLEMEHFDQRETSEYLTTLFFRNSTPALLFSQTWTPE